MRLETERLIVRSFEYRDKDDLGEYMLQRVDKNFEAYPDFTLDKLEDEIQIRCRSDEFFAIELKCEKKVIGNIYFGKRDFNTRELGFVLNENYQKQGFGCEAAREVIRWAFTEGIHRIYAETAPGNIASWKTMEKLGMQREARLRQNVSFHSDENGKPIYWDTYVYAMLESDNQVEENQNTAFRRIYEVVKKIPRGRVASYGQVAALAGNKHWARVVGYALHSNPEPEEIPCYRVVTKEGRVSDAFAFGGGNQQIELLMADGIEFIDGHVDMKKYQWDTPWILE